MSSCNRHLNCETADAKALAKYEEREAEVAISKAAGKRSWEIPALPPFWHKRAEHCHDDDCEDCFGK